MTYEVKEMFWNKNSLEAFLKCFRIVTGLLQQMFSTLLPLNHKNVSKLPPIYLPTDLTRQP